MRKMAICPEPRLFFVCQSNQNRATVSKNTINKSPHQVMDIPRAFASSLSSLEIGRHIVAQCFFLSKEGSCFASLKPKHFRCINVEPNDRSADQRNCSSSWLFYCRGGRDDVQQTHSSRRESGTVDGRSDPDSSSW